MTVNGKHKDRSAWAIGGTTLMGLGVGFVFVKTSVLLFVAALLIGIGFGLLVASLIPSKQG